MCPVIRAGKARACNTRSPNTHRTRRTQLTNACDILLYALRYSCQLTRVPPSSKYRSNNKMRASHWMQTSGHSRASPAQAQLVPGGLNSPVFTEATYGAASVPPSASSKTCVGVATMYSTRVTSTRLHRCPTRKSPTTKNERPTSRVRRLSVPTRDVGRSFFVAYLAYCVPVAGCNANAL